MVGFVRELPSEVAFLWMFSADVDLGEGEGAQCCLCQRFYHASCSPGVEGEDGDGSACPWCIFGGEGVAERLRHQFRSEDVPLNPDLSYEKVRLCLPYLPQAKVMLPKYMYEKGKLLGKGPELEAVSFILVECIMGRDFENEDFINSLMCKYPRQFS